MDTDKTKGFTYETCKKQTQQKSINEKNASFSNQSKNI